MTRIWMKAALAAAIAMQPMAAEAGWKRMIGGQPVAVAKAMMQVTPVGDWNRASARPSKKGESWTQDGMSLNELSFFAGIAPGEAIYRERRKKDEPLPKFRAGMLSPEIVGLVEGSHRIILKTSLFAVDSIEPATFLGQSGVRFTYHYVVQDEEVRRKGEGRAAIVGGRLYLITYVAPAIHYFDTGVEEARSIMDSARI